MRRLPQRLEIGTVALVHAALASIATWPLVWRMASGLPGDLGDPLLNTFILGWDADRMAHGLRGLWDAPFYFPFRNTLAYSEHLLGIAVFTAPVQWVSGNPLLAYNVAFLGSYVLAGVGMYGLTRELWGRRDAAWVAAIAFAFSPHRVMQVSHLQVLMSGWMPVALWALHRYFRTGSRRALAGFVGAFCLQGLSNGYFLYFFAVAVLIVGGAELVALVGRGLVGQRVPSRPWRALADLAGGAAVVVLIFAPMALAYLDVQRELGFSRSTTEAESYSPRPRDYLRVDADVRLWSLVMKEASAERSAFPGALIVVLAGVGLLSAFESRGTTLARPAWRRHVAAYGCLALLAYWLSLGPKYGPYGWLMSVVPGFNGLRVPGRFAVVVALALAVLGAAGAALVFRRLSSPRWAVAMPAAFGLLIFAEGFGGPMHVEGFDARQRQRARLHQWLEVQPAGAILELPISGPHLEPFTLPYQYATLLHKRPIVNGYSGWGSILQNFLSELAVPTAAQDDLDALLDALSRIGVRYVVLHRIAASEHWSAGQGGVRAFTDAMHRSPWVAYGETVLPVDVWRLKEPPTRDPGLPNEIRVLAAGHDYVLSSSDHPDRLVHMMDGDPATGWKTEVPQHGSEWIEIGLSRRRNVGRIDLELAPDGLGAYPKRLQIESVATDGAVAVLFEGSVLPELVEGMVKLPKRPAIELALPQNESLVIRIRQTGQRSVQWEIADLRVWSR